MIYSTLMKYLYIGIKKIRPRGFFLFSLICSWQIVALKLVLNVLGKRKKPNKYHKKTKTHRPEKAQTLVIFQIFIFSH